MQYKHIVLASESPRRSEILSSMGLDFEARPSNVDESKVKFSSPASYVKTLSRMKAESFFELAKDNAVIGADTIVFMGGKVYQKPGTIERAIETVRALSGKWHTVYTGVTVLVSGKRYMFCSKSRVRFKELGDDEIKKYVLENMPLDKAGAYGIQDRQVVKKFRGNYFNIVGLPKERLAKILKRAGVCK